MDKEQGTNLKVISFILKDEEYAIPVKKVNSIERMQQITRVPNSVHYIKGVINLSGVVTPIVDLRTRFGIEEQSYNESTRIIIVYFREIEIGIVVDAAKDVIDIQIKDIEPTLEVIGSIENDYVEGVLKISDRLLILLNLEKVFEEDVELKIAEI